MGLAGGKPPRLTASAASSGSLRTHLNPPRFQPRAQPSGHIQRMRAVTMQTDAVGAQLHGAAILAGDLALLDQPQGLRHRLDRIDDHRARQLARRQAAVGQIRAVSKHFFHGFKPCKRA